MPINNIDKSLDTMKHKLDDFEFDFQESMWKDMETKLDAQAAPYVLIWDNIKRKFRYIFLAIALLTVGGYFVANNPFNTVSSTLATPKEASSLLLEQPVAPKEKEAEEHTRTNSSDKSSQLKSQTNETIHENHTKQGLPQLDIITKNQEEVTSNIHKSIKSATPIHETEPVPTKVDLTSSNNQEQPSTLLHEKTGLAVEVQNRSKVSSINTLSLMLDKKANELPGSIQVKPPFQKRYSFGIKGGAALNLTGNPVRPLKVTPYFGITYNREIAPLWKIGIDFTFNNTPFTKIKIEFSDTIVYPQGIGTMDQIDYVKQIFHLEGSILLQYKLPKYRSLLKFGLTPSYVLGHSTSTETSYSGNYPDHIIQEYNDALENTNYGIRKLSFGLLLGVEYLLTPSWSVNLDYQQGITDLSRDEILRNNQKHRKSNFKIGLTYWVR